MAWPVPVEALWNDLQRVRSELLKETEGLSQTQADWRPDEQEWSVGEILHHLTLAEVGTGKLTSKLFKDAPQPLPSFPSDLTGFAPVPAAPPGPAKAPEVVYPERGHALERLLAAEDAECVCASDDKAEVYYAMESARTAIAKARGTA